MRRLAFVVRAISVWYDEGFGQQFFERLGIIGRDEIHAQGDAAHHVLLGIDRPGVDDHAVVVRLADPVGTDGDGREGVVYAPDTVGAKGGGCDVAVAELDVFELVVGRVFDDMAVAREGFVMVDDDASVGGHPHVEFGAVDFQRLCCGQCRDRVLGSAGGMVAAVGDGSGLGEDQRIVRKGELREAQRVFGSAAQQEQPVTIYPPVSRTIAALPDKFPFSYVIRFYYCRLNCNCLRLKSF